MNIRELTYDELELLDDALEVLEADVRGPRVHEQRAPQEELEQYLRDVKSLQTKIATARCELDEKA